MTFSVRVGLQNTCTSFCTYNGLTTFCLEGCEIFLAQPVNLKSKCCFSVRKLYKLTLPAQAPSLHEPRAEGKFVRAPKQGATESPIKMHESQELLEPEYCLLKNATLVMCI